MEGDGIGPEISAATLDGAARGRSPLRLGLALQPRRRSALRRCARRAPPSRRRRSRPRKAADGVILGPVSHNDYPPVAEGGLNPSGEIAQAPRSLRQYPPGAHAAAAFRRAAASPVDLVIVRENTEGFYADRSMHLGPGEFMPTPDLALAVRKITRARLDPHRGGGVRARACGGARR